jgi:hypothetical protein
VEVVNTDSLVELLSANLEPVDRRRLERRLALAVGAGGVAAFGVMLATVGLRPQLASPSHLQWSAIKLMFALSVVLTGAPALARSARPGSPTRALPVLPAFLSVAVAAVVVLLFTTPGAWGDMLLGATPGSPARCVFCILSFATIPSVALIYALRAGAPTRPCVCGAMAGLVAGGVGAAAYALACTSDSIPFIAAWYVAVIALYAALGALLGPRLLHW